MMFPGLDIATYDMGNAEISKCLACGFICDARPKMIRHIRDVHKERWAVALENWKTVGLTDDDIKRLQSS